MTTEELEALEAAEKIRAGLKNDPTLNNDPADDDDTGGDDDDKNKPVKEEKKPTLSDNEAKLIKEVMKQKAAAKKAADDLKALQAKVDGIDLDEYKTLKQKREEEETSALEKKGEYERLLAKQKEAADAAIKAEKERADKVAADLVALQATIEDLTTGQAFSNSKFVTEKLTLTPNKAKALYKSHFEFVEGKFVGYDKPKGAVDRTPIVDSSGEPVDFDAAIESIINADPDKDYLIKATLKPGSSSKQTVVDPAPKKQEFVDTTDKIAAGLEAFMKATKK